MQITTYDLILLITWYWQKTGRILSLRIQLTKFAKKLFRFTFFSILAKRKKFFAQDGFHLHFVLAVARPSPILFPLSAMSQKNCLKIKL